MKKILCIGNALFDTLVTEVEAAEIAEIGIVENGMTLVDAAKNASIKKRMEAKPSRETIGGAAANCARAARHLGAKVGYVGKVGLDAAGDKYISLMQSIGIESRVLRSAATPTGQCVSLIGERGERSMATYLGAALELQSEEITPELFQGYDVIFIEGYLVQSESLIRSIVAQAQALDMTIALDLASYNIVEESKELLAELVESGVDIIFANESEAEIFCSSKDVFECAQTLSSLCRVAVVKIGKDGSIIASGDETVELEASHHVAIDTTAAGDYYAGAFLAGYSKSQSIIRCGAMATMTAGAITAVIGTELDEAQWQEVFEYLEL